MRARRADSDLEDVEDAQEHRAYAFSRYGAPTAVPPRQDVPHLGASTRRSGEEALK
jgi:hypothetical protein